MHRQKPPIGTSGKGRDFVPSWHYVCAVRSLSPMAAHRFLPRQRVMSILVTGAAGFIGSALSEALLARGDHVVGLDDFNAYYDPGLPG
jgi:hypothetical protein